MVRDDKAQMVLNFPIVHFMLASTAVLLLTGGDVQGQGPALLVQELRIVDNHLQEKKKNTFNTAGIEPTKKSMTPHM